MRARRGERGNYVPRGVAVSPDQGLRYHPPLRAPVLLILPASASLPGSPSQLTPRLPLLSSSAMDDGVVPSPPLPREKLRPRNDSEPHVPVILIAPPPVEETRWNDFCRRSGYEKADRTDDAARAYGDRIKAVGKEMGCPVLDARGVLLGGEEDARECPHLSDGLHLTDSGNTLLFSGLMDLVRAKFPDLKPMEYGVDGMPVGGGVPMDGSFWTDLC